MFTELSGLFFIHKIMYLQKREVHGMRYLQTVLQLRAAGAAMERTRRPAASQRPGQSLLLRAGARSRTLLAFCRTILLMPDLRRVSLGRDACWPSPAPRGNSHNGCFALLRASLPAKARCCSQWGGKMPVKKSVEGN